jgi:hypothetical protein
MKGYNMWNNLHPSDKLTIKAVILLAIVLAICAILPASIFFWWIVIGSVGYLFYKKPIDSNHHSYSFSRDKYETYLKSDIWKLRRANVLIRDNHECQMCGRTNYLHVHHITYKNLGKEPLSDLVTLCSFCHKKVHDYHGKNAIFYPIL